jgi:hypothetical protein
VVAVLCAAAVIVGGSTSPTGAAPTAPGAAPDEHVVSVGPEWNVYSPAPGHLAAFAQAFATDHVVDGVTRKKVFVSWAANVDSASAAAVIGYAVSGDGGQTFATGGTGPVNVLNAARLDDGSLLAVEFLPIIDPATGVISLDVARSSDLGNTWTRGAATFDSGAVQFQWIRVHRGILRLVDGTLLMPVYGLAKGDTRNRSTLLQSTDNGATWTVRNPALKPPTPTVGTNETVISRTSDGRLVALLRADGTEDLFQTFSSDDGRTWSPATGIAAPPDAPKGWVDPAITLQPNGMLVLTYGRPDNTLLVSRDGTGRTWEDYRQVFANPPRATKPARYHGSSGNTAIVSVAPNQSVVFGDSCANIWGCREYGQLHRVWARRVDVVTPGAGKIDLTTKVRSGSVTLAGAVAAPDPTFPETRLAGAVDGSAERDAAARLTGPLTVTLDREYTVDRIGLMLGYGVEQNADVQLSVDGRTWTKPVVTPRGTVDYAMRYTPIAPTRARYVRVTGAEAVTELELYAADVHTFENDPLDQPPRGFTDTRHATVTDTIMPGADSRRRLSLVDLDPQDTATATLPAPNRARQRVSFSYAGAMYGSGVVLSIPGETATGWQFHLRPSGGVLKLRARTDAGWVEVGALPNQPPNDTWMPVVIDTTATEAMITVNGVKFPVTHSRWQPTTGYTGLTVSSWSVEAVNMQHEFDDVTVTALP